MERRSSEEYTQITRQAAKELEDILIMLMEKHSVPTNAILREFFNQRKALDGISLYNKYTLSLAL